MALPMTDKKPEPTPPFKPPYVLPPNWRDTTHEHAGTIFAIVGYPRPPKDPEEQPQRESLTGAQWR
jgi:hypothetical protein